MSSTESAIYYLIWTSQKPREIQIVTLFIWTTKLRVGRSVISLGGGDKPLVEDEIGKLGFSNKAQRKKKSLKTVALVIPLLILIQFTLF